ncbi:hypothetical protein [Kineosporia sp. R_H_3]|uniref:hypothetical protein n=1 Tax=Kineosporia sp. R_H_3 TaxID=1961848 RepID=UPI001179CE35|nr:hypothetical protein [Kineosporia sp. R_H_3]
MIGNGVEAGVRRRTALLAVVALAATTVTAVGVVGAGSGRADAAVPTSVAVPRHVSTAMSLSLVAASPSAAVVRQTAGYEADGAFLRGTSGLMTRFSAPRTVPAYSWVMVGSSMRGGYTVYVPATDSVRGHRVVHDPVTGVTQDTDLGSGRWVGESAAGWLELTGSGVLRLHTGSSTTTLLTGVAQVPVDHAPMAGTHAAVRLTRTDDTSGTYLFDLTTRTYEVLTTDYESIALDDTTVAWVSSDQYSVSRRALAGGPVTTIRPPHRAWQVTVFDGGVAYLVYGGNALANRAVVWRTGTRTPIVTTISSGGVIGIGTKVRAATGGTAATAGLYDISANGTATRVATVPAARAEVRDVDLAAGRVYTTDSTVKKAAFEKVWWRSVTRSPALALGAETLVPAGPRFDRPAAFSAGRGVMEVAQTQGTPQLRFVDRGALGPLVNGVPFATTLDLSGPYASVGTYTGLGTGTVVRADGRILARAAVPTQSSVFGPLVLSSDNTGKVTLLDVEAPRSVTNPRVLRASRCVPDPGDTGCVARVALGGDTAAWSENDGSSMTVLDLRTGVTRSLEGKGQFVTADVGVLAWVIHSDPGSTIRVLDTTSASAAPVDLVTTTSEVLDIALDDGLLAWRDEAGNARVSTLPFDHARRPRLLGVVGTALSPDGDGRGDTWAPKIDVTKPLGPVTLTIRKGTTVVRSLTGTAPDGSIRNIVWDGRDTAGALVADGPYTWTLTGDAADGDGGVRALDGVHAATGVVAVDRTPTTTTVTPTVTSALAGTAARLKVRWAAASDVAPNPAARYDVRVRKVTMSSTGRVVRGPARLWRTTTARSGTFGTSLTAGAVYQFSARTTDAAGNVGPWSTWRGASVSYDDRSLEVTRGSWTRSASKAAYKGTVTTSVTAGSRLTRTATWGSRITVVGTRCATCGRMKVYVDGVLQATVDTQAATTTARQTLFSQSFPRGRHRVSIVVNGTPGRPSVRIDAVGYHLP